MAEQEFRQVDAPASLDARELAHRQYLLGVLNRRMAMHQRRLDDAFSAVIGEPGALTLICACGRDDCEGPLLAITPREYDLVRESAHRFVVSSAHNTEIDEVVYVGNGFAVVEIKPPYRDNNPPTSEPF